jgi:hypothetical protein
VKRECGWRERTHSGVHVKICITAQSFGTLPELCAARKPGRLPSA